MGRLWNKARETFLKLDLFANSQLLKHKGQGAYQTYTGSFFSVLIIAAFIALFYSSTVQTFQRQNVTFISKSKAEVEPVSVEVTTDNSAPQSKFMFAVGLQGFDLSQNQRYFDIVLLDRFYKNGVSIQQNEIKMESCTLAHWSNINSDMLNYYSRLNFSKWLCPPINHTFRFGGKFTSENFEFTKLVVRKCTGNCVNAAKIDQYISANKTFKLNYYFVNPVINPSEQTYLEYYLEDRTFFEFTNLVGVSGNVFYSSYQINTDSSILPEPTTDIQSTKGLILTDLPTLNNYEVTNNEYAKIYLRKSSVSIVYERAFKRIDNMLSYIGGLFSMFLIFMYGLVAYSEYSYEFDVGSRLYVDNQRHQFQTKKLNIFTFWIYLLYCVITFIYAKASQWSCFHFYRRVDECREEVKEQLDVTFLMKRVVFIEKAIELNFSNKLSQLDLNHKWTLNEAKMKRQFYNDHEVISNMIKTSEKKKPVNIQINFEENQALPSVLLFPPKQPHIPSPKPRILHEQLQKDQNISSLSEINQIDYNQIKLYTKSDEMMSELENNSVNAIHFGYKGRVKSIGSNDSLKDKENKQKSSNESLKNSDKQNLPTSKFRLPKIDKSKK